MKYSSVNITDTIFNTRPKYVAPSRGATSTIRELGPEPLRSVGNTKMYPSVCRGGKAMYSKTAPAFLEKCAALHYRNPMDGQLADIGTNEPVLTNGFEYNSNFDSNPGITHLLKKPMRITEQRLWSPSYQMQKNGSSNTMVRQDRSMSWMPSKYMPKGNHSVLIPPVITDKASLFCQPSESYWGYKRDATLLSDLQYMRRHPALFPYHASNSELYDSYSEREKLSQTRRCCFCQHHNQNNSMYVNFKESIGKRSSEGMHAPTWATDDSSYQNPQIKRCDSWTYCSMQQNKPSISISGVNEVNYNQINSGVKSKYRHGKRLVQRLLGVFCCDGQKTNIANRKGKWQQTRQEEKHKITEGLCPEYVHETSFRRFQAPNFYCDQSDYRYSPDRWVIVAAFGRELEVICQDNSPLGKNKSAENMGISLPSLMNIPVAVYLQRIAWLFDCSKECFVIALEYIHRLIRRRPELKVNYSTVHQLIVASLRVSNKFFDDKVVQSSYYAHIVDLPANTISVFERQLLYFLNFDLNVRPDQYYARYSSMLDDNQGPNRVTIWPRTI